MMVDAVVNWADALLAHKCGKCGQVSKSIRWMPWRQEAMKDVGACDKLREAGKQAMIRRCPNGETRLE